MQKKIGAFLVLLYLISISCLVCKAESQFCENPYITFSPDGKAFTTNADETDTEWYKKEYTIHTGKKSTLRKLNIGEHYYDVRKSKKVSVGKWVVMHAPARCIHDDNKLLTYYHGIECRKDICHRNYYSGWISYCADCGEKAVDNLFYMSDETARLFGELDMSLSYYYRCPHCTHLEMGTELKHHICKGISVNQYEVRYDANMGKGYMPKSAHMYNNGTVYEGREITPQKTLTMNSYTRLGYEFEGWNTERDGSGIGFQDGQEIFNLTTEEQGVVVLYAQWKRSRSTLKIDPNGGCYKGVNGVYEVSGDYGSIYNLADDEIIPPDGVKIHFETNGGGFIEDLVGDMTFKYWDFETPFHGEIQDLFYIFKGSDGAVDYAKAIYSYEEIILPECQKEGYSFGGWYYDDELTKAAGNAGTELKVSEDITLYACWVDLQLSAMDNYMTNAGKGAVDLKWKQLDSREKTYMLYQKKEDGTWNSIYAEEDLSMEQHVRKEFLCNQNAENYVIPFTGYYKVTLYGAQGENYQTHTGGKGGKTTGEIYLKKGERLKITVGGQNGYNGGGNGLAFGNGGGYTGVSVDNEILMIAGGGGGATAQNDGMPGGFDLNNVSQMQGQNGMAGGGGGSRGGMAGTAVVHAHEEECIHEHIGSTERYGGCYIVKTTCGNQAFIQSEYKNIFYYGNRNDRGDLIYCVRCGSYSCPGHLNRYYKYQCTKCKTEYYDYSPGKCSLTKYALGCGKESGYICGYEEGDILQATAAYGGSSYIDTSKFLVYDEQPGEHEGNGKAIIEAVLVGFTEGSSLNGVEALDEEAPESISISNMKVKAVDENKVNVVFKRPVDRGTVYFHKAESYDFQSKQKISTSNVTKNNLISGVIGYYYTVDNKADTIVTTEHEYFAETDESPYVGVVLTDKIQYLHIAAADKAGNLSDTTHYSLSKEDVIFWPIVTKPIQIMDSESVFCGEDYYYVKADGNTPFEVSFESRLCGTAGKEYQINYLEFETKNHLQGRDNPAAQGDGRVKINFPMEAAVNPDTNTYKGQEVKKQYTGVFSLTDGLYSEVRRNNYCKDVEIVQKFFAPPELDGSIVQLIPGAGVLTDSVNVFSDRQQDSENSLWLVADGKGPEIGGFEMLEELFPQKDKTWKVVINISAVDQGSGLQELSLKVRNTDNGGYMVIEDEDGDGRIELEMNSESPLYKGAFVLLASAKDNVGNETVKSYGMDDIALYAHIEKMSEAQNPKYKRGEFGKLIIEAVGYMDCAEVIFPQEWTEWDPDLNRQYNYTYPDYIQMEELEFMVPYQVPDGSYTIVVKAHKGERTLSAQPELLTLTIEGSVLDEIRTRLR